MSVRLLREYLGYRPTYLSGTFVINDDEQPTGKTTRATRGKSSRVARVVSNKIADEHVGEKIGGYEDFEETNGMSFESVLSEDEVVDGGDDSGTYTSDYDVESSDGDSAVYSGAFSDGSSKLGGFIERIGGAFDSDTPGEVVVYGGVASHGRKKYRTTSQTNPVDGPYKSASTVPCNTIRLFVTKQGGSGDDFNSQEIPAANDPSIMQLLADIAKDGAYELDPPEDLSPDRIKDTIWDIIGGSADIDDGPRDSIAQDDENAAGLSIMDMIAD